MPTATDGEEVKVACIAGFSATYEHTAFESSSYKLLLQRIGRSSSGEPTGLSDQLSRTESRSQPSAAHRPRSKVANSARHTHREFLVLMLRVRGDHLINMLVFW